MGNGVLDLPQGPVRVVLAGGGDQVDFFIRGYSNTKFSFFGWDVYLTTTHISMIIVIAAILVFAVCASRAIKNANPNKVPGPFLNVVELIVESLDGMVKGTMGPK